MPNTLEYFTATGSFFDVEQPLPQEAETILPQVADIDAYVDFFPGTVQEALSGGLVLYVPDYETYGDTELAIAPITGRTNNGILSSITIGDPNGVGLVVNSAWLDFGEDLYYHVRFRNVTYGGGVQRLSWFAFKAPTTVTEINLTDPDLERFTYRGP